VTRRKDARLFVPLGRDEALRLSLSVAVRPEPVEVAVAVNGTEVGSFEATPEFSEYQLPAPGRLRKGTNTLSLRPRFREAGQILLLDRVTFELVDR
jgi:hypothetical protein